jgi:hypothetical protein
LRQDLTAVAERNTTDTNYLYITTNRNRFFAVSLFLQ